MAASNKKGQSSNSAAKAPRIMAFAGSVRRGSYNRVALTAAMQGALAAGAEVTLIDLKDYALPLYDADLEAEKGLPQAARQLKELAMQHDGFLIATPEYNSGVTPLLKNTIDWMSRPEGQEPVRAAFQNKVAALVSASPTKFGGLRSLAQLTSILGNMGVLVMPNVISIALADEVIDAPHAKFKDEMMTRRVEAVGGDLALFLKRL